MRTTAVLLLASFALLAQTTLTEEEAVVRALASSPELLALRQSAVAARAHISRATAISSPELRLGVSDVPEDLEDVGGRRQTNVGLRWSPPRPGEPGRMNAIAEQRAIQADGELAAARNRVAAETRLLHRTIRLIDEQIRLAREVVDTRRHVMAVVTEQVQARVKTAFDGSQAEVELAEAKAAELRLISERRIQLLRLGHRTGMTYAQDITLAGDADVLTVPATSHFITEVRRQALEQRSEVASAAANTQLARLTLSSLRRERVPWFSFVQVTRLSRFEPGTRWGFHVGIDLGVFRWNSGRLRAAEADAMEVRLRETAVRRSVEEEVEELLLRLEQAQQRLLDSAVEIESLAERHLEMARRQLGSGESDRTEPLLAKVRLLNAQQSRVVMLMEYWALAIGLEQALGRAA